MTLRYARFQRLKVKYDQLPSNFAFNCNPRHYIEAVFEMEIDSKPFHVKLKGIASSPCSPDGDAASGMFVIQTRITYVRTAAQATKFCATDREFDWTLTTVLTRLTLVPGRATPVPRPRSPCP